MACWNFLQGSRKSVPTPSLFLELPKVYPPLAQGYTGAGSGATVASQAIENIFFLVWWLHFLLMSCSKTLGCRNNKYRLLYDHSLPWDASEIPLAMEVKDLRPCTSTRHPQFIPTSQLGLPGLSNSFPCHLIKLATKWLFDRFTHLNVKCLGLRSDDTKSKSVIDLWFKVHCT